ncbi:MAG: phosphoribosylformylglycinamidine synthase [Flavobacteriaceae bacterium]|nr:phosphoribosylformylglycinamidine synthase [Flavobacteriaceae bacterium]MDG1911822.1 phosphoribosylformylglycinamidine synthase [Flavobacteriaceae bacterium]
MILFFGAPETTIIALQTNTPIDATAIDKLSWLFDAPWVNQQLVPGFFIGPRANMITPWSTNAVEISENMGITGIVRIEQYHAAQKETAFDSMLFEKYKDLNPSLFDVKIAPESIKEIQDIGAYNDKEGLSLNAEEVAYLESLSKSLNRPLTDSEVFGFSQVNSEHCRHKIFNGTFIIDGKEKEDSLFKLIKKTSKIHPNTIVSAYKDNVAFIEGDTIEQFAPSQPDIPSSYEAKEVNSIISLKAETHNFPTTVEPFNGAATGSGGEIRDRLAGGKGSIPLAGTAVYMTPYSRVSQNRPWEKTFPARPWRYQTPLDILIKASNGASDFGNKFGQPLIAGSLLTFEHQENQQQWGYDKVIMLAGGVGMGVADQALKDKPSEGDLIVILGGDNYRIGMGGAAVSSVNTGAFDNAIELNAVQRSNPEMQKRVANTIRALVETGNNPIVSIHDHGAGGHLNCLSELVEETGGTIYINQLPLGDPTLSAKEIIGNESQERMGLIINPKDHDLLERIASRERAPMYVVGKVTENHSFLFVDEENKTKPIDLKLDALFGSAPKTILNDTHQEANFEEVYYHSTQLNDYLEKVLQLEAVACKDWLTNKVDRCVSGRVAQQQTVGELQIPLSNCGVVALDYKGKKGIATSIGHAPIAALIEPAKGSVLAIAESLTNIIWAPLSEGLKSVSLSANWMWACNNDGEDARLYDAVESCSDFAIALGINIPTGKDSLSMKQEYENGKVTAPGTVIISAGAACSDITKIITPDLKKNGGDLFYLDLSKSEFSLGGSALAQVENKIGNTTSTIADAGYFKKVFNSIQKLIIEDHISAGHDISSGGLITTLLEMCFPTQWAGMNLDLSKLDAKDLITLLFSENSGIIVQSPLDLTTTLASEGIACVKIGSTTTNQTIALNYHKEQHSFDVNKLRDIWYSTSAALDSNQTFNDLSQERFRNYKNQALDYRFPENFKGIPIHSTPNKKIKAAVIREQGSNSEREMAYALHLAGFEVIDVHMTDLISGRETLEDIQFIAAVGGFSNSDVLGSAKGWAGSFLYNEKAKESLDRFFARKDTLSIGVCNGCQLFVSLGLLTPEHAEKPKMLHNASGKFECHFTAVDIQESTSLMLKGLEGSRLGIWAAHGEGKFHLPKEEKAYQIPATYHFEGYPANPNGSDYNAAMLCSQDGRHLVMMPHLERSTFPWNWGYYPEKRNDKTSPWLMAFENAFQWLSNQ